MYKKTLLFCACVVVFYIAYVDLYNKNKIPTKKFTSTAPLIKENSKFYTFGVVPQYEQRKIFHIWRPILNELELRTNINLKMVGTAKIPDFTRKFLQGKFDFAYMNPYHMLQAVDSQGYEPLVRDGGRQLSGIIVVHKDSSIKSITDLQNFKIAFPSANALGASLLVKSALNKHNINYTAKYVQTHSSVYLHVAKKLYFVGGGVLSTLNAQKDHIKNSLRIIYQTPAVAPHPISAHSRVPKKIRNKIKSALLDMSKSEQFKNYLSKIPINKMIPAKINDYLKLRDLNLDKLYLVENADN